MAEFTAAQERAINILDRNIAVSAGAGAGKTRVLVERYINILRQGKAEGDEILAITFTNKAAKEMKERIRGQANKLAAAAPTAEQCVFWRDVKTSLEYAPIGTFHSFCARVLRENPVEAAIDPNFSVLDEIEAALLVDKTLTDVLEQALEQDAEWLDKLLAFYDKGLLLENVPGLYDKLSADGLLDEGLTDRLTAPYNKMLAKVGGLRVELEELCHELISYKAKLNKATGQYARVDRIEHDWETVSDAIRQAGGDSRHPDDTLKDYLGCLDRRSKDKEIVGAIRLRLADLQKIRADRAALTVIPCLAKLLLALDNAIASYKTEHRVLTFNDLEIRTVRLLKDRPAVRKRYNQRFRQIMVDEFQDTNEKQRQIIYLIAGGDDEKLTGEKLFVVGDAKQSIYRFRGADVAVFDRVRQDIEANGGELIELDVNFRSVDSLLELYNECFSTIMGTGIDAVRFTPLSAFRSSAEQGKIQAEFIPVSSGSAGEEQSARDAEATAIANRIRRMVEGRELLIDQDTTAKPVKYGDVAVLFRTMKDIDTYAAALQSGGIPYYIVGGRGFYDCQEVLDILNLLRVVDNHYQDTALVGVLRSPQFMVSDFTLAKLKLQGGCLWDSIQSPDSDLLNGEEFTVVARAGRILNNLRQLRDMVGIDELIVRSLTETGYGVFMFTQFMGQQKYANLVKLVSVAKNYQAKGQTTLGDFLQYVDKLTEGGVKEGEAQIESEGGDTVKLMTVHKAKGLEFPVVFLPDLHRKFKDETGPLLFAASTGLGLKIPDDAGGYMSSSVYEQVASQEKLLAHMELKRLLYVAFTRAKDYLVLSGVGSGRAAGKEFSELGNWLAWLCKAYGITNMDELPEVLTIKSAQLAVNHGNEACGANCHPDQTGPNPAAADTAWLERFAVNIKPIPDAGRSNRRSFSASNIMRFSQCQRAFFYQVIEGLPEVNQVFVPVNNSGRPPGNLIGSVLHRCLELAGPERRLETCLAQAVAESVPPEWRSQILNEAAKLIERYRNSDFFKNIGSLPAMKEWQFNLALIDEAGAKYYFSGRIDSLISYPDGSMGIIDYKTDKVNDAKAAVKAENYGVQLMLYTFAVEAAFQKTVKDAKLYFVRPDLTVDIPLDAAARQAALARILGVCRHAAKYENEEAYDCNTAFCGYCGYRFFCPGALNDRLDA
jgi:ATP-dependent helicase/nuclease subunit A